MEEVWPVFGRQSSLGKIPISDVVNEATIHVRLDLFFIPDEL